MSRREGNKDLVPDPSGRGGDGRPVPAAARPGVPALAGAGGAVLQAPVSFEGTASVGSSNLLRSPVSGQPCVHWRLRIVEHLTPRTQLVHEVASSEPFELTWAGSGEDGRPSVKVRLDPETARIQATPVLHREGTPGARAAARHFGLAGAVSVEEVVIHQGEDLSAEGILEDAAACGEGPFRATARGLELLDATVRTSSRSLAPVLLPWALGTAAALLSGMGLASYAAWRYHLLHLPAGVHLPRMLAPQPLLGPPEVPRPRLP